MRPETLHSLTLSCSAPLIRSITFPGYISPSQQLKFSDLGTEPLAAWSKLPDAGKAQIITAIFCVEFAGEFSKPHYTKGGPMPPQFDPLGFGKNLTPEQMKNKQIKELKNGRLAMVGIMSFFAAATKVGSVPFFKELI